MPSPIRPTDDEARALARALMEQASSAALAVDDGGWPAVSRIAFGLDETGAPISLVSDLSAHTAALRARPECALLIGEPGTRGDPLTHPRLTIRARADFIPRNTDIHKKMAAHYLRGHPKAKLYIGFADFHFVRFVPVTAFLNGGFGQAFSLTPEDLAPPG